MKKKKHRPQKSSKAKQKKVSKKAETQPLTSGGTEFGTVPSQSPSEWDRGVSGTEKWDRWVSERRMQLEETLRQRDTHNTGSVDLEDFERSLLELGVPCSKSELHILTQKLRTTDNTINYQDLATQLHQLKLGHLDIQISEQNRQEAANTEDVSSEKTDLKERFIRLRVCMIPFDWAKHPGNFEVVLSVKRPVLCLMGIIQERVGIGTTQIKVFRSRLTTEGLCLCPLKSLEECGFRGGTEGSPEEATVYYDYTLLRRDCPILNCDHYFTKCRATVGPGLE